MRRENNAPCSSAPVHLGIFFLSLFFFFFFFLSTLGDSFHVDGDFLVCPVWEEDDLFRSVTRFGGIGIFEDVEK